MRLRRSPIRTTASRARPRQTAPAPISSPDIPAGTYTLTVTSPKFRTSIDQGLIVEANQNIKMDIRLVVGEAASDVTVTAEGSTIDTRSATLGTMIDNRLVEELPINGENVVALAALLPGVTNVNAPTTVHQ